MKHLGLRVTILFAFVGVALFSVLPQVFASDQNSISTSDIIALVEEFENEGQITNERVLHTLTMHLNAVDHYEQQGESGKVVKHMNSFKKLLDHQKDNDFISENVYDNLIESTNNLIKRWDDLAIVSDGQANAAIIVPSDTIEDENGGALAEYIEKSTGIELPILTDTPGDSENQEVIIYIGHSRDEDAARHQELLQGMNEHGFIIESQGNNITIIGTTPRATEYGVYEFLERYVGVRWLMPGPDGEHVPQHDTIEVPQVLVQDEPATISRHFFGMNGNANQEWYKHNRFHHNIQFHHNMNVLFDPEVFADHPEYYADGEVPTHEYSWQPCFNDETAEVAIQRIIEYFDENPEAGSYSLGINDGTNYCEDINHPDYPTETNSVGKLHRSDVYYRWVNKIAEGVTEVYPDKYFGLLAYREMYDPPMNEDGTHYKLHPNVVPYITDDRMSWIDPSMGEAGTQHTENWQQAAENLGWYEYLYGSPYNVPRVYMHKMAENYQYADTKGVIGHVAELYPNFGEGPKPWLSAKLQWNPNQDVDQLLNDWYETAVGEDAAPYLQQYYEHWEEFWTTRIFESTWYKEWANASSRSNYLRHRDERYLAAVTREDVTVSRQLLEQVVSEAKTDEQQTRAELLLRSFEYYEASVLSYPRIDAIDPPETEEEALGLLNDVIQSVEMAEKRTRLLEEFEGDPILDRPGVSGVWDGVQVTAISALQNYVETEPEDGIIGEKLEQFLEDIPYYNLAAKAVKTAADKEEILQTIDFSTGPWTDAEPFSNFFIMNTEDEPPVKTNVYLLWDDENLYVGYENFDDDLSKMVVSDDAPDGWWASGGDDSVETYVTDDPSEPLLGFFTNPNGVKFSRNQSGGDLNNEWPASAQVGDDRWNTIQVIPFSSIDVDPNETGSLRGFFFRNYHGHDAFIGWEGGAPWKPESLRTIDLVGYPLTENSSFETGNESAPPWSVWQNHGGIGERVEGIAHSGNASFMFDSMKEGGLSQIIDVEPGPILAQLHYYTPGMGEDPVQLNFGFNLRDEDGNKLSSIDSEKIRFISTEDKWSVANLFEEVPKTVNGVEVKNAQLFVTIRDDFETKVYVDDFSVYQHLDE